jgi:6,7-dimethyl-8-ribityllumazine synthase
VVFGVLTTENDEQALERSSDDDNKGREGVETAIEMVNLLKSLSGGP